MQFNSSSTDGETHYLPRDQNPRPGVHQLRRPRRPTPRGAHTPQPAGGGPAATHVLPQHVSPGQAQGHRWGKRYVRAPHLTTGAKQAPTLRSSHRCLKQGFPGQRGPRVSNSQTNLSYFLFRFTPLDRWGSPLDWKVNNNLQHY